MDLLNGRKDLEFGGGDKVYKKITYAKGGEIHQDGEVDSSLCGSLLNFSKGWQGCICVEFT